MSVLKSRRHESAAEYVNVADEIFAETMGFLLRLSLRYQRLLATDTMHAASEVLDHAEKANNIRITDRPTYEARIKHLAEARAAVMALDVHMYYVYSTIMQNPQGAFTDTKGNTKSPTEATRILGSMAESLGEKIDTCKNLITGVLESDRKKHKLSLR